MTRLLESKQKDFAWLNSIMDARVKPAHDGLRGFGFKKHLGSR
jgi:hypothetical protein